MSNAQPSRQQQLLERIGKDLTAIDYRRSALAEIGQLVQNGANAGMIFSDEFFNIIEAGINSTGIDRIFIPANKLPVAGTPNRAG